MNHLRNRVQLIGNLGQDPEIFKFDNGQVKARFSLATNETYRNKKGDKVVDTAWHTVVMFGKTAEIAERFLTKGNEVGIEGKISYRSYEDKTNNKRFVTEIVANELMLMTQKDK